MTHNNLSGNFAANPHGTNELLNGDGFYVSFNAKPCADMAFLQSDGGAAETALAVENGLPDGRQAWFVLNGDFRAEYVEAFPRGLAACVAVYESHRAVSRSSWSNDGEWTGAQVLDWVAKRFASLTSQENA